LAKAHGSKSIIQTTNSIMWVKEKQHSFHSYQIQCDYRP